LRGCIGTFTSSALEKNLPKYVLIAALNDSRFSPISLKEVPDLQVGVSLLVNFEPASHPLDWEVGKHGIEIDFVYKSKFIFLFIILFLIRERIGRNFFT